ncbi:MAG: histidine phosphatase family protein [Candidatus Riflebacteria bacterium]|nr:histidine phosphatase family protein [Candidatus Riflebacteria bacterium]
MDRWLHLLAAAIVLFHGAAHSVAGPTRFHFARHGETVANRTGVYTTQTLNVLSAEGEAQVERLTARLAGWTASHAPRPSRAGSFGFDVICVSPVPRAMSSILPYLRSTGSTAEVWPALAECCHQKPEPESPGATLPEGKPVQIDPDRSAFFTLEGAPSRRWPAPKNFVQGIAQVRLLVRQLKQRFDGSGKSVLLVGHACNGSLMMEMLLGREPRRAIKIDNAMISVLEETWKGGYRLIQLNGKQVSGGR